MFIAQCNQEIMPFNGQRAENMEEERRLFYVALTRSSRHLYLHAVKPQPLSPFLAEAGWQQVLPALQQVSRLLQRDPQTWQAADAWELARTVAVYHLDRYFRLWWDVSPARRRAVATTMRNFLSAVAARNAWRELGLQAGFLEFWAELAPDQADEPCIDFPGLGALLARGESRVTSG